MCSRLSPVEQEQEQEQERQNSAQHSPVPFNEAAEHSPVPFKEAADTAARQQNFAQGKRSFQAAEEVAVCSPLSPAAAEEEHSPSFPAEEEEEEHSPLSPAEEEEEHDGRGF